MLISNCNRKMSDLEPIIFYKMNKIEAKAFKIALMWEEECKKELKGENYSKLKRNTDPRKSLLFKYCYKLAQETKGIIKDEDLIFYIRSQIQILKSIREGSIHALIEPHCLVGDKAWRRWKLWKYKFKKDIGKIPNAEHHDIKAKNSKIKSELNSDFEFIKKMQIDNYENMNKNKSNIIRWLNAGEISFYYAVISPWIKKIFKEDELEFDRIYFRSSLSPQIEQYFREKFNYEF